MHPGYPDIHQPDYAVAHGFGGHDGFIYDREIGRTGTDHHDRAVMLFFFQFADHDDLCRLVIYRRWLRCFDRRIHVRVGFGRQNRFGPLGKVIDDLNNMRRGLPFAEDYFGEAGAQIAMRIDPRKT